MTVPTGDVGNCYEYRADGRRLAGTDQGTIEYLVRLSRIWPRTWHQYRGPNGYVTWAHAGREITSAELPPALRGD
jgi:hypothetical protein